jgi:ligand-binding sensor domain-containing protein
VKAHRAQKLSGIGRDKNLAATLWRCLFLAMFSFSSARAQYRVDAWTSESGVPSNWVMALQQTRDGHLWVTTNDGLVRFGGLRFRVVNKSDTPGLTSNFFFHIGRRGETTLGLCGWARKPLASLISRRDL